MSFCHVITFVFLCSISNAFLMHCEFFMKDIYWGMKYTCSVRNFNTTSENRTVTQVIGKHENKTDSDVTAFSAKDEIFEYFPKQLSKFFPNLELIYFDHTKLKFIEKDDFIGLKNLEILALPSNQLENLPSNLFDHVPQLKEVHVENNKLRFVGSQLLTPLVNLMKTDFRTNVCINKVAYYPSEVFDLRKEITLLCNDLSTEEVLKVLMETNAKISRIESKFTDICGNEETLKLEMKKHLNKIQELTEENERLRNLILETAKNLQESI